VIRDARPERSARRDHRRLCRLVAAAAARRQLSADLYERDDAYAVKCALLPNLPNNEGMFRPVTVTAPAGSVLNPPPPVAVGGRMASGHYVPMLVRRPIPDCTVAGDGGARLAALAVTLAGRQGRNFATVLFFNGGFGARPDKDGVSCLSWPSNISSTPVEVAERNNPIFFRYKRLREGSGDDGQHLAASLRPRLRRGRVAPTCNHEVTTALHRSLASPLRRPLRKPKAAVSRGFWRGRYWSGRGDSNPRPQPWQGCALPLSYTRLYLGNTPVPGRFGEFPMGCQPGFSAVRPRSAVP
jgi:hypothetical protein